MLRSSCNIILCKKRNLLSLLLLSVIILFQFSCSKDKIITSQEKDWLENNDSLTVGLFPYYPPYQFVRSDGVIDGIFIDYLKLIEEKTNYKFKTRTYTDWVKLLNDTKTNKIDIILEIQKTQERTSYLEFYPVLFESQYFLIGHKKDTLPTVLKDFKSQTIAVPKRYAVHDILQENFPDISLITLPDDLEALKMVNSGQADAYVGSKAIFNFFRSKENIENLSIKSAIDYNYKPTLASTKDNEILKNILTKAIKSITQKEKKEIVSNWLYNPIIPYYQTTKFWVAITLLVLLLSFFILGINKFLKFKIKQRTKELRIAKENAEESDRLKTNFIRNISHEIRTPMNGIIGFSEFLNNPELTDQERREYTQIIVNSGKQLMSIIEDILEISKLRAKQVKIFPEKTNLINLFDNLYSVYKTKAKEKEINLVLENKLPSDQQLVSIDKSKLTKIVSNLLDNAIKFTEKGEVRITYETKDTLLIITIQDTGLGIHPKDQKAIFKSFSQSEKEIAKNHGGLGLGLTIARENALLIGGHLTFVSKINEGTTFTIKLPYNPIQSEEIIESPKLIKDISNTEKHIILIAEDGEVNFLFLKMVLNKLPNYDFVIYRAKNGKEAVDICKENKYIDLVLMDIKMPVMDGYEATSKIKKLRPDLPIVAQTAYSTDEDIQKALGAGCDDFVSKPVDSKILKPILLKYFSMLRKSN